MPLRAPPFTVHDRRGSDAAATPAARRSRPLSRRADEHRRARSGGLRARPDLRRPRRRRRSAAFRSPPTSTARSCRRSPSRCCASAIGAPVGPPARAGVERGRRGRRQISSCRPSTTAPCASTTRRAMRRPLRLGDRRARRQGRSRAPRAEARADRRHRTRPARIPEHAGRRAHAGQRDPCAAAREPLRRHAAAPAGMGAAGSRRRSSSLLGGWLVYATPRWKPRDAALLMLVRVARRGARVFAAFRAQRLLFDAATPAVGLHAAVRRAARADAHGGDAAEAGRSSASCRPSASRPRASPASSRPRRRIQIATLPRADLLRRRRRGSTSRRR